MPLRAGGAGLPATAAGWTARMRTATLLPGAARRNASARPGRGEANPSPPRHGGWRLRRRRGRACGRHRGLAGAKLGQRPSGGGDEGGKAGQGTGRLRRLRRQGSGAAGHGWAGRDRLVGACRRGRRGRGQLSEAAVGNGTPVIFDDGRADGRAEGEHSGWRCGRQWRWRCGGGGCGRGGARGSRRVIDGDDRRATRPIGDRLQDDLSALRQCQRRLER
jgi:hypothetical protein